MTTKHTPGPWVADGCVIEHFDAPLKFDIAVTRQHLIWTPDTEHAEANARLIAAAPELLEACKLAADALSTRDAIALGIGRDAFLALVAAVGKAQGGTS